MTPSKGTVVRTIRIDPDLWLRAQQQAASEGRSVSEAVREWLDQVYAPKPTD